MKIYRGDYICVSDEEDYDQKEFLINFDDNFMYIDNTRLHIQEEDYNPCFLFSSKEDAEDYVPYDGVVGIIVSEYELTTKQAIELIVSKEIDIEPTRIWCYSWNEKLREMEEFKLKAFL